MVDWYVLTKLTNGPENSCEDFEEKLFVLGVW